MNSYKNTFYSTALPGSVETITTDTKPIEYRGYQIYHRTKSANKSANVFDIVFAGACIGMYAGLSGAKNRIDEIINHA